MPASKTILYVIGSLDLGGAERHLSLIAPRLKQLGWEPTIYCISHRGVQSAEVERHGVPVIGPPWEGTVRQTRAGRFISLFASCLKLLRFMVVERPQFAHFFLPLAYIIGAPLAWFARVPTLVMSRRSLNLYQARHPALARMEMFLHRRMNAILGNSRAIFDELVQAEGCDPGKVSVVYNGIDIDNFDRAQAANDTDGSSGLVLIIVANLIPYKGHADLINALATVRQKMPERWTLLCVGRDDGIRVELEAQVHRLGLARHIRFLGERTDVESLLKRADIGILCSHQEGFANAILEGMAAKLPMVVTDVGGNIESVVQGETGLIVPPKNPQLLGEAILKLASDAGARKTMGLAARKRVEERFSIERCVTLYDELYHSLTWRATLNKQSQKWKEQLGKLCHSNSVRFTTLFLITFLTFGIVLSMVDIETVWSAAKTLSGETVLIVGGLLLLGALLATVRFWYMAADIGNVLSLRNAMLASSLGPIAGVLTVQFFGQITARSILLSRHGLSLPANILLATYERLVAAMVSAAFAIMGAWHLFGRLALDLQAGGNEFLRIAVGLVAAVAAAAILGWGNRLLKSIHGGPRYAIVISFARNVTLTIGIQICTIAAYVVAAQTFSPTVPLSTLLAASAVIAFAASLPISFAGWGVRELSAILVLGVVDIQSGAALTISILIGTLALAALIVIAGVGMVMPRKDKATAAQPAEVSVDIVKVVQRIIPLIAATAVYFQIQLPVGTALLNVNLADPAAILGGALFLFYFVFPRATKWRLAWLDGHVIIATAVVVLAFLHGYHEFGWTDWAFNNKMLGWFVLLCYGATGALIVATDRADFHLLLRTFVGTAIGIVLLHLTMLFIDTSIANLPPNLYSLPLDGFSHNRNAFAFILVLAVCSTFVMPRRIKPWLLGILLSGLWYAGSRAGWGALAITLTIAAAQRILQIRTIIFSLVISIAIVTSMIALSYLSHGPTAGTGAGFTARLDVWNVVISPSSSDVERFTSILGGFGLFLSNPIFGSGLGAYVANAKDTATPVIIHSTPVWLLGEMGLIGFLAFAIPAARILWNEWSRPDKDSASKFLILILIAFAIMSSIHEMLYQRAMWLLLGAALAYIPRHSRAHTAKHQRSEAAN